MALILRSTRNFSKSKPLPTPVGVPPALRSHKKDDSASFDTKLMTEPLISNSTTANVGYETAN